MGALTRAMTRLRDEIVFSRHARVAWRGDLARQSGERRTRVSALCAGFASDRADAQLAWAGRTAASPAIQKLAARPPIGLSEPSHKPHSKPAKKH